MATPEQDTELAARVRELQAAAAADYARGQAQQAEARNALAEARSHGNEAGSAH